MELFWQIVAGGAVSVISILITAFIVSWKLKVDSRLGVIENSLHEEALETRQLITACKDSIIKHFEEKFVHKDVCKTHHKKAA